MKKVFFVSLGCDKNLVDSEKMLGSLSRHGFCITDDETAADVIVINTCCFINDAKEESIQAILEMAKLKETGACRALVVTGCLAQRYHAEIPKEIPEVDAVIGTGAYDTLVEVIAGLLPEQEGGPLEEEMMAAEDGSRGENSSAGVGGLAGESTCKVKAGKVEKTCRVCIEDPDRNPPDPGSRLLTTGGHYAYLKIAEGCNKRCTYCIIPNIRGHYRSFPMEQLLAEAKKLAEGGVKELILVAQETTLYGTDLYGKKSLHLLVRELAKIPEIRWIRLLYCYPEEVYDELIETIRDEEKVCHYLDIPIQHADDEILRRMGRKTNRAALMDLIEKLRREIPDIVLRTTLISGFPGETLEAHETLMDFVDEMAFDRLGVFTYSPEEGTKAALMEDQIPEEEKLRRQEELMALQQEIAFDLAKDKIGRTLWVMVEGRITEDDVYVCRTYGDAPDVDGYLFLQTDENLMSGDFVRVRVTDAREYDLIGSIEHDI